MTKNHDYCYGNIFEVFTDKNPSTYVITTTKLDAMSYRWLASLSHYNFILNYKNDKSVKDVAEIFPNVIKALTSAVL